MFLETRYDSSLLKTKPVLSLKTKQLLSDRIFKTEKHRFSTKVVTIKHHFN